MKNIDAVILAGGLGTRLNDSAGDLPKALVPVNGKPFLEYVFKLLCRTKFITRVVIAVGYKADKIISKYQNNSDYGFEILFSVEKDLLGTGGAIKKALQYTNSDNVLVLNGDSYVDIDIQSFISAHDTKDASISVALTHVENANRFGKVNILTNNKIVSFEEKAPNSSGGYINCGVYLFRKTVFDHIPENTVLSLEKDLLPNMTKFNAFGFICTGKFIDIGIPETYNIASDYLKEEN
ncbi:NTP transferase domain-containing protein [bacterium]|nr:MAG: NTP transferase domain-containing protein [bacterium]